MCQTNNIPHYIKDGNSYLYSVMEHTAELKRTLKQADYELQQLGRPVCHHCQNQPPELHCQQWIEVDARPTDNVNKKLFHEFDDTNQIPYVWKVSCGLSCSGFGIDIILVQEKQENGQCSY